METIQDDEEVREKPEIVIKEDCVSIVEEALRS